MHRLAWLVLLLGCGAARPVAAPALAPIKRCLVLATNDSESNFDGPKLANGSYLYPIARVAAVKRQELARHPRAVLLVDAGDLLQGRYMERKDGATVAPRRAALATYAAAGYDLITLGNHEFDAGPATLWQVLAPQVDRTAAVPVEPQVPGPTVINSNVQAPFVLPRQIAACGGLRVGFFGLLTPSSKTISDFGATQFVDATDPVRAPARRELAWLRAARADLVILLSHLGAEDDVALAKDVTGVDVVIGGHSHTVLPEPVRAGTALIGQAGSRFAHLAFWELTQIGDGPVQVKYHLEPIDERMPLDLQVKAQVDGLRETLISEVVIGERASTWDLLDVAHGDYPRKAARAVQEFAHTASGQPIDGALLNLGGFRSATLYPPGPVTNVEVRAIHPFKNRLVMVRLTGEQLKDTLENACTTGHSEQHGRNLAAWGVDFSCDVSKPVIEYEMRDLRPVAIRKHGERATATLGGKPLDPKATYTIATLDYLAKGGSGYFALTQADRKCLDGKPFEGKVPCPESPLLSEVITRAVQDGSLERPLP